MKRALLGSTALVAAELCAVGAMAADGVKLTLGGYYHAAAGGIAGEDFSASSGVSGGELRDYAFKQNIDVTFSGERVADLWRRQPGRLWFQFLERGDRRLRRHQRHLLRHRQLQHAGRLFQP